MLPVDGSMWKSGGEFQLESRARWIQELGISYHLGVDGLAVSLVWLVTDAAGWWTGARCGG